MLRYVVGEHMVVAHGVSRDIRKCSVAKIDARLTSAYHRAKTNGLLMQRRGWDTMTTRCVCHVTDACWCCRNAVHDMLRVYVRSREVMMCVYPCRIVKQKRNGCCSIHRPHSA